jgi:error-prone DNA polymerase
VQRTGLCPADAWTLVLSGACDSLDPCIPRPQLLWELSLRRHAPATLFGEADARRVRVPDVGDYDATTLLRLEVETLGFLLSRHPLTLYRERIRAAGAVAARDMHRHAGRRVRMIGWYVTSKTVTTKHDEPMEFVSFEDTTALYETTFFPDAYRRLCRILSSARPYLLEGRVEEERGAVTLTVHRAEFLDREPTRATALLARRASFAAASRPARSQATSAGRQRLTRPYRLP